MPFLLIGGHAVNAHGIGRQTADVDLLIKLDQVQAWKELLQKAGFRLHHQHRDVFLQFIPEALGEWPIDLMAVDTDTFARFLAEAQETTLGQVTGLLVPSANHLIALKLHAWKQGGPIRELQDLPDIVALMKVSGIQYTDAPFRAACLRYGTEPIYAQIAEHFQRSGR